MATFLEKMFFIEGVTFAIIGLLFFIFPLQSIIGFSIFIAIAFIIMGIVTIIRSGNREGKWFYICNGVINVLFGLVLWVYPITTLDLLVVAYGVWVLVRGIYLIIFSIMNGYFGLNIYTAANILFVIFGALVVYHPFSALISAPYLIGSALIITALGEIYMGFKLKNTFKY